MCEGTDSRCTTTVAVRGTRLRVSGLSRFLLPTLLCGKQRKVGAAPHRGNANKPLPQQVKAKARTPTTNQTPQRKPPTFPRQIPVQKLLPPPIKPQRASAHLVPIRQTSFP